MTVVKLKPKYSNYSDQSQQEQTTRWTNHSTQQLPVIRSKRGKNHAYVKPITERHNRNRVFTFTVIWKLL